MREKDALPAEVSSFVGRSSEIAEVKRLLSAARLITLTGVGGAGKTRLALRVATELRRAFADGVWMVDLASVRDPSVLAYAVAETVGAERPVPARDPARSGAAPVVDTLVGYLRDRRCLLVLDNCEHLLDGCAALVDAVLRAAPGVRILCTSRQPLRTMGEHVWTVPPLPVPDPATVNGGTGGYAAVSLFVARAAAAVPQFTLTGANQGTVVDICQRLDGLPLAIELAAAQVRTLSLDQLADGLAGRLGLLSARRPGSPRHRTLDATFDWSYALCSEAERVLWTRLSVFEGSFDLDAVRDVCSCADLPADGMLDVLAGLVDKSVVMRVELEGVSRYRLLETVRAFAAARLADPETVARRHRDRYLRLSEQYYTEWFGPEQVSWSRLFRLDYPNLRVALSFSLDRGEVAVAQRIAANLVYRWLSGDGLPEGRHWLGRVTAADASLTASRVRALASYGRIRATIGELAEGAQLIEEAGRLAAALDEPALVTLTTCDAGLIAVLGQDFARAGRLLTDALDRFRALGTVTMSTVMAEVGLGLARLYQGDVETAHRLCAGAVASCRARGERWWQSQALVASAHVAIARGRLDDALEATREALRQAVPLRNTVVIVRVIERLGVIAMARGEHERGVVLTAAADPMRESVGLTGAGRRMWPLDDVDPTEESRRLLDGATFEAAVRRGREMTIDDAVAYALDEPVAGGADPGAPGAALPVEAGPAGAAAAPTAEPVPAGAPAGEPATGSDRAYPLTRREREVALLIAEGRSNREIADRLVVSTRTAESHVENILRKLGFSSRAQIATWVAGRGRDQPDR